MKKVIVCMVMLVLMIALLPSQQTEAATVNKHYIVKVDKLNVREKASPKAKIVGSLKKETTVYVYSTEPGGWAKIKYKNKAGFIASSGLKEKTVSTSKWNGKWSNKFGDVKISNQTSTSYKFSINVGMGGHVGEIEGTAKIKNGQGIYTEYIEDFEGLFDDPTCRITFKNTGKSITVKESGACTYYHGMAATFDGVYKK